MTNHMRMKWFDKDDAGLPYEEPVLFFITESGAKIEAETLVHAVKEAREKKKSAFLREDGTE